MELKLICSACLIILVESFNRTAYGIEIEVSCRIKLC